MAAVAGRYSAWTAPIVAAAASSSHTGLPAVATVTARTHNSTTMVA